MGNEGRRDRRESYRVRLDDRPRASLTSSLRLTDVSVGGVGLLARRPDAPVLDDSLLVVHVTESMPLRARVQRVELGAPSEDWVRVGARFVELADEERSSLCAFITSQCA